MKKLLIISVLFFISCKAQKQITMEQKNIIIPEINNQFEKFDILNFQKNGLSRQDKLKNNNFIITTGDKKDDIKKSGFSEAIFPKESYFNLTKNFSSNGNIEIKGLNFNNGSEYGIWYEFDENGKLIKEINTDKGYEFSWKDIIKYCEKNKIPLTKGYKEFDGFQTSIFKNEIDSKKVWEITYQISGDEVLKLTLDGVTGELLKQEKEEFINH